ncbi:MAG: nicotinate phosphoribosyltransferase [Planctomycetia bacterium]|nr:nicotinate phosphoribosyltransferase [Planctomycetia bacterium]
MSQSLFPDDRHLGLLTDLYELTMAAGYYVHGLAEQRVTFELFMRRVPACRNLLIAGGLEQAVHYLRQLSFSREQIDYLRRHPAFAKIPGDWFDRLASLRFDGDVWAVPEGTVVFGNEPLLRITGPLMIGQIVETYLIATLTMQTLVASKAARVVTAAQGRPVIDFGSRRAHGPQAGLLAARAAYLAGCAGTSNVEAGRLLNIPTLGTQAHAWIMAWGDEVQAFRHFGELFPNVATLLIDTYDTPQGARNAIAAGVDFQAVRLDSGDLGALSTEVRRILDDAGKQDVKIVASGDLNETKIRDLLKAGAPIDTFGVGTELVTSRDEPTLSTVYKLVEQETDAGVVGRCKLSKDKTTYPFAKQIYRSSDATGYISGDLVARATDNAAGEPLLTPVLRGGQLVQPLPSLEAIRTHCQAQLQRLPPRLLQLERGEPYPVRFSDELEAAVRK